MVTSLHASDTTYPMVTCHMITCHMVTCLHASDATCPMVTCHMITCHMLTCHMITCHMITCHVRYLLEVCHVEAGPEDRWGHTPLWDAQMFSKYSSYS